MNEPVSIRLTEEEDRKPMLEWFFQPGVLKGFPLCDMREVEDAIRICMSYLKQGAVLTALWEGVPCGIANLYLQSYKKLSHQCLFAILIDEKHRGKGVGTLLLKELMKLAKEKFHIELLHLEVYEDNPAIFLYKKLGFQQYGRQVRYLKDGDQYFNKILMQKPLL